MKINHSKFIIEGLSQRCHMIFLVSLFVTSRLFGVFLPRKVVIIFRKIGANFRQVSLKSVLLSVNVLEFFDKVPEKKLNL